MNVGVTVLNRRLAFPDPQSADPRGLVAVGGDLSESRLLLAYRRGLFPWTADPITWWSPDPRGILELDKFHASRSLERVRRSGKFHVTIDRAFGAVIRACAAPAPRRRETWISTEFIDAYMHLHGRGHAHSVECWLDNELAGGVYGVAVGGLFAGESMFHRVADASKIALYHLVQHLRERGFALFDIQMVTPATVRLGGVAIARQEYLKRLAVAVDLACVF